MRKTQTSDFYQFVRNAGMLSPDITPLSPSHLLTEWLKEYGHLATAINTEKARSEFLTAPVLAEVRKQLSGNYINDVATILEIFVQLS